MGHTDAEKVGRVVEADTVTREVRDVKEAAAVQGNVAAEHEGIEVGKVGEASAPVAEITETETTERQVRPSAGNAQVAVPTPAPKTTGVETGMVGDVDKPVARVVEKETTERHVEPARSAAIHTSAAKDTAINTGVMDAQAREVGEIVETATVSRNVVPSVGPKVELPLDHADISTNRGTTTL